MLLKPNQNIPLVVYYQERQMTADLDELTGTTLVINCEEYFDKHSVISFTNPYFKGQGIVSRIEYVHRSFHYTIEIAYIHFKPGILINQRV